MRKRIKQEKAWLLIGALSVLVCSGLLTGCGGDGDDDDAPANAAGQTRGDDDD